MLPTAQHLSLLAATLFSSGRYETWGEALLDALDMFKDTQALLVREHVALQDEREGAGHRT